MATPKNYILGPTTRLLSILMVTLRITTRYL
jgi:hypothetical protein